MSDFTIRLPLSPDIIRPLRAGDTVLLTGKLYTARDAAHKRMIACLDENRPLPFDIQNQLIYYAGPAPASPGHVIGPAGPTTSYRMDAYTPRLLQSGLIGMMGKGMRNREVIDAMIKATAVYFGAVGGAAALISKRIVSSTVIAYEDLGAEAIRLLEVKDFPAIVLIDSLGNNLYESGPAKYRHIMGYE